MRYDAIVLAYGKGARLSLGYNKVLYKIEDETILDRAIKPFLSDAECNKVIVVLEEKERSKIKSDDKIVFCDGGEERYTSVMRALKHADSEYIMIHDGARPDICDEDLHDLKEALKTDEACLLASKVKDTVKRVKDGYVVDTIDRSDLYLAKTPQAFRTALIKDAYDKAIKSKETFTDDTQVLKRFCDTKIKIVKAHTLNNKVTYKEDLDNLNS